VSVDPEDPDLGIGERGDDATGHVTVIAVVRERDGGQCCAVARDPSARSTATPTCDFT
jgi:hypothetical protein